MKLFFRRIAARTTDYLLWGIVTVLILGERIGSLNAPSLTFYASFWIFHIFEAVLISLFGATVGKRLFGIRVLNQNGEKLSLPLSIKRAFLAFGIGTGFFLPYISLILPIFAVIRSLRHKTMLWDKFVPAQIKIIKTTLWDKLILSLFFLLLLTGYALTIKTFYLYRQPDYAALEDKILDAYIVRIRPQMLDTLSEEAVLTPEKAEQAVRKLNDIQNQTQNLRNELKESVDSLIDQFNKLPLEEMRRLRIKQANLFFQRTDEFLFSESMRTELFENILNFFEDEGKNKYTVIDGRPVFETEEMRRQYDNYMTQLQIFLMMTEPDAD